MEISSGSYKVYASGSIIQYNNESVSFSMEGLLIIFKFITTTEDKSIRFEVSQSGNSLTFTLYNFDNPLGSGNSTPIQIGTIRNKKLYLNYRVYALSNLKENRTLYYTFYLGEEASNVKPVKTSK